jgi:hypothetical protein
MLVRLPTDSNNFRWNRCHGDALRSDFSRVLQTVNGVLVLSTFMSSIALQLTRRSVSFLRILSTCFSPGRQRFTNIFFEQLPYLLDMEQLERLYRLERLEHLERLKPSFLGKTPTH